MNCKLKRIVGWWHCYHERHDWRLVLDEPWTGGDIAEWWGGHGFFLRGLPSRHCVFECGRCGVTREFHRWAFVAGSGALYYFFDRYWPITFTANASREA